MTLKKTPARIFNFDKNMKLIAILCDPVKRALSHFLHVSANDIHTMTQGKKRQITADKTPDQTLIEVLKSIFPQDIIDYLETEFDYAEGNAEVRDALYKFLHANDDRKPANFVTRGVYAYHVKHWQKYFPPDQLLFINGRDLMINPGRSLMQIQDFIGVAPVLNETNFWFNKVNIMSPKP